MRRIWSPVVYASMKSNRYSIPILLLAIAAGCGSGGGGNTTSRALVSIRIAPTTPVIALGTSQQFTATGTFSDNTTQDLTSSVAWNSSTPSVATISNAAGSNGQATSTAVGPTTITATQGGISPSTVLTVTPATLASIRVLPSNSSVAVGIPQQFTATGTFSDNSAQDLTSSVTWSSSAQSVATISNNIGFNGRATPVATGTTTIAATMTVAQPPGSVSGSTLLTVTGGGGGQANVMPITVDGSLCSSGSYLNKPCVSVMVCTPGTSTCQTISDILLDTGSFGFRIFKQALSITLPQVTVASGSLASCVQFGDGSSMWGPVQTASVVLGGEPAVQTSIQVIDSTFGIRSMSCQNADARPAAAGLNGFLGVGLFAQDCGPSCVSSPNIGIYFACNGSTCNGTAVPLASQIQNPVAILPQDNNGVLVQLPSVPLGGATSVDGSLILGIGTRSNNSPSGVTMFPANQFAEFITTFNGTTFNTSFIDSGSNGLFFSAPASLLPACPTPNSAWFCPAATQSLSATTTGATGSPSAGIPFQIGNLNSLLGTGHSAFVEIGGNSGGGFDWGLPFFFGRNVFLGIEGSSSSLGTGPYWAY
jgi:hypothetical protein